jgi:hypothetical protein
MPCYPEGRRDKQTNQTRYSGGLQEQTQEAETNTTKRDEKRRLEKRREGKRSEEKRKEIR